MLDRWFQTLENEKQRSLGSLTAVCEERDAVDVLTKEVELNYLAVRRWLVRIYESGYKVNDDLSKFDRVSPQRWLFL